MCSTLVTAVLWEGANGLAFIIRLETRVSGLDGIHPIGGQAISCSAVHNPESGSMATRGPARCYSIRLGQPIDQISSSSGNTNTTANLLCSTVGCGTATWMMMTRNTETFDKSEGAFWPRPAHGSDFGWPPHVHQQADRTHGCYLVAFPAPGPSDFSHERHKLILSKKKNSPTKS